MLSTNLFVQPALMLGLEEPSPWILFWFYFDLFVHWVVGWLVLTEDPVYTALSVAEITMGQ